MKIQTENQAFLRDTHSKALLMKDSKQADDYKLKSKLMKAAKERDQEINSIKEKLSEFDVLRQDVEEIKNLLKGLVNK